MKYFYCFSLIVFIFLAFFYGLSSYAIIDLNEGLYAEIAREMLATHQYIIPHLNYVPYLEKPPLLYCLIAASYKIFSVSTFAARLIPALSATLVCGALLFFAQKIQQFKTGWLTAIILASSIGFIIIGRVVFFDMLLTAWLTLALTCFYLWFIKEHKIYLYFSYIFIGLAFLTKGLLPVVLASIIVMVFLALTKTPRQKFLSFFNPIGILLFLLIIAPWIIMACLKLHSFAWDYFVNEQLFRFLGMRIPDDYHTGPIYFYFPRVIVYLLPWSLLIPVLFTTPHPSPLPQGERGSLRCFLWVWFLVPFIFFSLSNAKGDYYMVLGTPALAYLIAIKINSYIEQNKNHLLTGLFGLQAVMLLIASAYVLWNQIVPQPMVPLLKIIFIYLLLYSAIGLGLIYYYRKPLLTFLLIAGLTIPLVFFYINFRATLQDNYSQLKLAQYIQTHDKQRPVYLFQDYEKFSSILFFLQQRLSIIDTVSEDLYFGAHTPQAKGWFIPLDQFKSAHKTQACYVALLKYKLDDFNNKMKPEQFCVVANSGTTFLLSNVKSECSASALDLSQGSH